MITQAAARTWAEDNSLKEVLLPLLSELEQAITKRSRVLKELQIQPSVTPAPINAKGEAATFGIDLILEICRNTIPHLPSKAQEDIERSMVATTDQCFSRCISKARGAGIV